MNSQTVFTVFFAIFWGGVMNTSWRWRMFQPLPHHGRIAARFVVAFFLMTILPLSFYVVVFRCLEHYQMRSWLDIASVILPSLFIFVCYRAWMAIIERWPKTFYWSREELVPDFRLRECDPSIEDLGVIPSYGGCPNATAAAFYVLVSVVVPVGYWVGRI